MVWQRPCLWAGIFSKNEDARANIPYIFIREESNDPMKIKDEERAEEIFNDAWEALSKRSRAKRMRMKFPAKMVWLNGAPGSGKGTNTASVMRVLEISSKPIVMSSLLKSPEDQSVKASGNLVDDERVVTLVFKELLRREYVRGVVIDGFPRTRVQAICMKLLAEKLRMSDSNRACSFRVMNFTISRKTSIARQLKRGRDAIEHNKLVEDLKKIPVRETDLNEATAEFRYQTYEDKMRDCIAILREMPEYCEISTEGSMESVRNEIYRTLSR